MEDFLARFLFEISSLLLIPVIVSLLLLLCWTILICGGFFAEFLKRRRNKEFRNYINTLIDKSENNTENLIEDLFIADKSDGITKRFLSRTDKIRKDPLSWAKLIDDIESYSAGILIKCSMGIKIGPMLGLMGALIPLGPALIALSSGNINELAEQMTVAFTTTVVGLLIGGISYIITQVRKKWYAQDISDIKYVYELIFRE
ncbi:MAG: MotA/TolQ/ExbB proton channel family protein [Crocinitomicaceae bacterium]|nr:MotA/TolQ/ExbB proton channel family protein [Crocinitomicaceae bacterium]